MDVIVHLFWQVKKNKKIKFQITCLENDELYSFGWNSGGELCIGTLKHQLTPKKIKFFGKMKINEISCGAHHVMITTGKIF